jgi:hypothetical protein
MPDGHYTELHKIAALQCAVISRIQPFFPLEFPVTEPTVGIVKCNEIFALSYALGILELDLQPTTPQKTDFWLRLLDVISNSATETIEPYIEDQKLQITKNLAQYDASIGAVHDRDKPAISSLICIFELLSDKGNSIRS